MPAGVVSSTTPFCGSCGWDVRNGVYSDKNDDAFCDSDGADLTRFGFGSGLAATGTPGTISGVTPYDFAGLETVGVVSATPWDPGEFIVLGDGSNAYWDGNQWLEGLAP